MKALRLHITVTHAQPLNCFSKGTFGARQSPGSYQGLPRLTVLPPAFHGFRLTPRSHPFASTCASVNVRQVSVGAISSLLTQQAVSMPITQDHSSFANYQQAAVTHVDLSKCMHHGFRFLCDVAISDKSACASLLLADLSVHFDSKSVQQLYSKGERTLPGCAIVAVLVTGHVCDLHAAAY